MMALAADAAAQSQNLRVLQQLEAHRKPAMTHVMSWTSNSLVLAPAIPIGMMGAGWTTDNRDLLQAGCVTGLSLATRLCPDRGTEMDGAASPPLPGASR